MKASDDQQKMKKVFATLHQIELNSELIEVHSIVYMGLSRAGKSALMNWQFHSKSIVGRKFGTNIFYIPIEESSQRNPQQASNIAQIGHGFSSVTIMANMRIKQKNRIKTTFTDFGGFGQRRNAFQIIKVNYALATYLLRMKKVKFILVITQHAFNDISSNGLRDTLNEFVRLFDFNLMSQNQQQSFLSSISLCITSATKKYEQSEILEQLAIIIKNFEDKSLYDEQTNENNYIQKYPICKMILETLIKTRRFQLFPLAEVGKSPPECHIIRSFDQKKWSFTDLESIRESICYPYVQQYFKLKESEKLKIKQIITKRFNLVQKINRCLKRMVKHTYQNMCSDGLDLKEYFQQLSQSVIQNNFYKDLPVSSSQLISQNIETSLLIRFQKLKKLYQINENILMYNHWLSQQSKQDSTHQKVLKYYNYLNGRFKQQMEIFYFIFGCSPVKMLLLTQIQFIIQKSLYQCMIFQNLNRYVEGNQLANQCRMISFLNIHLGDAFTDSIFSLKTTFVRQLYDSRINIRRVKINQFGIIIKLICEFQAELKQLDSAMIYSICNRLLLLEVNQQLQLNGNQKALRLLVEGLQYCIKQQLCLEILQNVDAEKSYIQQQKKYINCFVNMILAHQNVALTDFIIQICKNLKQYSIISRIYRSRLERHPNNAGFLSNWAEYQRLIGNGELALKLYTKLQNITKQSHDLIKNQILNQSKQNSEISLKNQLEESQIVSKDNIVKLIDIIRKKFLGFTQNFCMNFQHDSGIYNQKMKKIIINKSCQGQFPKNPNNYQYLYYSNKILEIMDNKKITIMLPSGSLRGQTTLAYALSNAKLHAKTHSKLLGYDLVDSQSQNRINHYGDNPTEYPFIRSLDDDEFLVDFMSILENQALKKVHGSIVLQKMIQKCQAYRFILVQNEKDILENNGIYMINFFKLLLVMFKWDFSKREVCQKLSSMVYLFFTFVNDRSKIEKKLKEIRQKFKGKHSIVENQRIYGLSQKQQKQIYCILTPLVKQKKQFFDYPKYEDTLFRKDDWIRSMQNCGICNNSTTGCNHLRWTYISSQNNKPLISQQIVNFSLLETQISILLGHITQIIKETRTRVAQMSKIFLFKYTEKQFRSPEEQLLFFYHILKLKQINFPPCQLPYQYHQFFNNLQSFNSCFFEGVKNCCQEAKLASVEACQQQLKYKFYELQTYSIKLAGSQKVRQALIQIRKYESDIQQICENIQEDDILRVFFREISVSNIRSIQLRENKIRMMKCYKDITQIIRKSQQIQKILKYISFENWIRNNQTLASMYTQLGMKKQAIQLQISTIKQLNKKQKYFFENYSIQQANQIAFQQTSSFLADIAGSIVITHPQLSIRLCVTLNLKEKLLDILQRIYEDINTAIDQKINTMVRRIVLNSDMGRNQRAKSLLRDLQNLTYGNKIGDNFKVMNRLQNYATNNKLRFNFPNMEPGQQAIMKLVSMIEKEIF